MGSRIQEVCQAGSHKSSHGLPGCLVLARAGTAGQRSLRELLSPLPGRPARVCTSGDPRRLQSWRRGHAGLHVRPGAAETDGSLTNTLGHPYHPSSCSPQVDSDLRDLWASVADTGGKSSSSPHLEAEGTLQAETGPRLTCRQEPATSPRLLRAGRPGTRPGGPPLQVPPGKCSSRGLCSRIPTSPLSRPLTFCF